MQKFLQCCYLNKLGINQHQYVITDKFWVSLRNSKQLPSCDSAVVQVPPRKKCHKELYCSNARFTLLITPPTIHYMTEWFSVKCHWDNPPPLSQPFGCAAVSDFCETVSVESKERLLSDVGSLLKTDFLHFESVALATNFSGPSRDNNWAFHSVSGTTVAQGGRLVNGRLNPAIADLIVSTWSEIHATNQSCH